MFEVCNCVNFARKTVSSTLLHVIGIQNASELEWWVFVSRPFWCFCSSKKIDLHLNWQIFRIDECGAPCECPAHLMVSCATTTSFLQQLHRKRKTIDHRFVLKSIQGDHIADMPEKYITFLSTIMIVIAFWLKIKDLSWLSIAVTEHSIYTFWSTSTSIPIRGKLSDRPHKSHARLDDRCHFRLYKFNALPISPTQQSNIFSWKLHSRNSFRVNLYPYKYPKLASNNRSINVFFTYRGETRCRCCCCCFLVGRGRCFVAVLHTEILQENTIDLNKLVA